MKETERTVTLPASVSFARFWSPVRAVEQRLTWVPTCCAVQEVKETNAESPAARLVTFWVLV